MTDTFFSAHAVEADWRACVQQIAERWRDHPRENMVPGHGRVGFLYLGASFIDQASAVLTMLKSTTGIVDWIGTVGAAIIADDHELHDGPAMSVMIASLPRDGFHVFSGTQRAPRRGLLTAGGHSATASALIHVDPSMQDIDGLIRDMAGKVDAGYVFGGIASGDESPLPQFAGVTIRGGVSGIMFASHVALKTRVTQGCAPLAASHRITSCEGNLVVELDDEPALDVMLSDLGIDGAARTSRDGESLIAALSVDRLRHGLYAGLASNDAGRGFGFADYRVRQVAGIDPHNRLIAIGEQASAGERLVFCTRDVAAARRDLIRMATELREEIESEDARILGGIYVSCVGRGQTLFGRRGAEVSLLRAHLGAFPLTGFYANGEIARDTLYGYTGVLTLFTAPR